MRFEGETLQASEKSWKGQQLRTTELPVSHPRPPKDRPKALCRLWNSLSQECAVVCSFTIWRLKSPPGVPCLLGVYFPPLPKSRGTVPLHVCWCALCSKSAWLLLTPLHPPHSKRPSKGSKRSTQWGRGTRGVPGRRLQGSQWVGAPLLPILWL